MKSNLNTNLVMYKRLFSYIKSYKLAFLFAVIGNIFYGLADAGFVKFIGPLLDRGFVEREQTFIFWAPFIIIGIFTLRGVASFVSTYFMGSVGRQVVMRFRQEMFSHILNLPIAYFDKSASGKILAKITYNVEQVAEAITNALSVVVKEFFKALSLFAVMLNTSWRFTLLFLVMLPIMSGLMYFFNKRMRRISTHIQESIGSVTHEAQEAIEGQRVIKAFGGAQGEIDSFTLATKHNRQQEMKLIITSAVSIPSIQMFAAIALAATVYFATLDSSHFTPGKFATLLGAMIALLQPIKQLTRVNAVIQKGMAGAQGMFELLDEQAEVDTGTHALEKASGHIEYRNVSFGYRDKPTLSHINFTVKPGEIIAIVGRSGAGKSTLVNLLPRFYDCETGNVFIDNIATNDIPLKDLRRQIAIVSQQVTLFNDTVLNNIAYGCCAKEVTLEDVIAAAKGAHALDFIQALPDGFDTVVGENGARLSGGQKQRIAIARAILKQAPILILDEATSSLDSESEKHIQAALETLMAQSTTLVIAHRLSTIEHADRIMVVDEGHIIEMGSHAELMALNGLYASLRAIQYQQSDLQLSLA